MTIFFFIFINCKTKTAWYTEQDHRETKERLNNISSENYEE